jgi:hypothetical protein
MRRIVQKAMRPAIDFVKERMIRDPVASVVRNVVSTHQDIFCQQIQRSIVNQYLIHKANKIVPYKHIKDAGFRVYSQFEEDGIILYILTCLSG